MLSPSGGRREGGGRRSVGDGVRFDPADGARYHPDETWPSDPAVVGRLDTNGGFMKPRDKARLELLLGNCGEQFYAHPLTLRAAGVERPAASPKASPCSCALRGMIIASDARMPLACGRPATAACPASARYAS